MKRSLTLSLALLALVSCSIEQRLARTSAEIEDIFAAARDWEQLPLRTISWNQALSIIREKNNELRKLESSIRRNEREELSVYTDMIPGVSYYGYMTKSINDVVSAYSSDDVNSTINVTFNLPSLTNIPYRVYSARANTYAAMKMKEGKERELMADLYQNARSRELELRTRALKEKTPDMTEQTRMLNKTAAMQADAAHWKAMADMLGDYSARWQILPESLPRIKWSDYSRRLKKLDPLTVSRFALQLERARLGMYGIALQYLPTINTNLYSPSLFSSSGGSYQGTFLDGEDTRINLNISYTLDTQLDTWNSYQDRKADYEQTKREVKASIMEHKRKLALLRRSVEDYSSWKSYMEKRIRYTRETPVTTADEQLTRDKALHDMRMEMLNQEAKSIESEAAVLLEYGLP
ncbi:MAG: TolC family protein [Akkermansia sp.]|nr:TolC family protein [Akkermansia sp.]